MKKDVYVSGPNEPTRYVQIQPGLLAGAYILKVREEAGLYVRAQLDPTKWQASLDWDDAWRLVRSAFGIDPAEVRMESRVHLFDDGAEIRQLWLGPQDDAN